MKKSNYSSKRILFAILLISMFIFVPNVFEDLVSNSITINEDTSTGNDVNYVITTSKLQTISYDTSVPFVLENNTNVIFDGVISPGEYPETYIDSSGNKPIVVHWEHNDVNLSVAIEVEGLGFVALGLGSDKMNGADMIIGGDFGNGTDYCLDAIGQSSYLAPVALDTQSNILSCSATENATSTVLEFKIPMNSADSEDKVLETNSTYNFFFAYHLTLDDVFSLTGVHPHTNPSKKLFLRPSLEIYQTQISIIAPPEVEQGKNFTLSTTLLDENQNPINDLSVNFFRETQYGKLIIGSSITNNNGTAYLNYSNDILSGNVTFGVIFNEFIGKIDSLDVIYLKSEVTSDILFSQSKSEEHEVRDVLFIPINDACCEGGIFYLLILRDVVFYLALFTVWGLYTYCVILALRIPFNRKKSKSLEENNESMEDI